MEEPALGKVWGGFFFNHIRNIGSQAVTSWYVGVLWERRAPWWSLMERSAAHSLREAFHQYCAAILCSHHIWAQLPYRYLPSTTLCSAAILWFWCVAWSLPDLWHHHTPLTPSPPHLHPPIDKQPRHLMPVMVHCHSNTAHRHASLCLTALTGHLDARSALCQHAPCFQASDMITCQTERLIGGLEEMQRRSKTRRVHTTLQRDKHLNSEDAHERLNQLVIWRAARHN